MDHDRPDLRCNQVGKIKKRRVPSADVIPSARLASSASRCFLRWMLLPSIFEANLANVPSSFPSDAQISPFGWPPPSTKNRGLAADVQLDSGGSRGDLGLNGETLRSTVFLSSELQGLALLEVPLDGHPLRLAKRRSDRLVSFIMQVYEFAKVRMVSRSDWSDVVDQLG